VHCLKCSKGTTAKYQICVTCCGQNVREKHRYKDVIKPLRQEIARLNKIQLHGECYVYNNIVICYKVFYAAGVPLENMGVYIR
jgi:hypothetical protein